MVAKSTVRTYGVNQDFQCVEGIWLHRNSRQIHFFRKYPILLNMCATYSELPSYIRTTEIIIKKTNTAFIRMNLRIEK